MLTLQLTCGGRSINPSWFLKYMNYGIRYWIQVKIQGLHFSFDDELLASCGGQDDCKLVVWRTKTGDF